MKRLWIAIGNPLRGDDAVAHRAVELAAPGPDVDVRHVIQLTPELAPLMAEYDEILLLDASVGGARTSRPWSHHMTPESLIVMARELFGFRGRARVWSLPAVDFKHPSAEAEAAAHEFARTWMDE